MAGASHHEVPDRVRAIPEGFVRTYGDLSPGGPRRVEHPRSEMPTIRDPDHDDVTGDVDAA